MNPEKLTAAKERVLPRLEAFLGPGGYESREHRDELTIVVSKDRVTDLLAFLRDDDALRFTLLKDVCVVDWNRRPNRFEVVYNLWSLEHAMRLRVKVPVASDSPHVDTIVPVYPAANWYEREAYDMHGIIFDGHPDLRRMYMPEDYVDPISGEPIYPMRKEIPIMGIPGSLPIPERNDQQA